MSLSEADFQLLRGRFAQLICAAGVTAKRVVSAKPAVGSTDRRTDTHIAFFVFGILPTHKSG